MALPPRAHVQRGQAAPHAEAENVQPSEGGSAPSDQDRVHILEACVVTWSKQIKNVLKADPDAATAPGAFPGPEAELNFWAERAANLKSIHEQLEGAAVQKVVAVLRLARSTYHPAYLRLHGEVAEALTQAADNVLFLAPLRPRLEKLLHRCAPPPPAASS